MDECRVVAGCRSPTQLLVIAALAAAGLRPLAADGGLSLRFVTALSLIDTALLLGLVAFFLVIRGDDPVRLFLGSRSVRRESVLGLLLVPVVLLGAVGLMLAILSLAPWLRNVADNPLASLLRNGRDVAIFGFVAVVAGGAREEVQRVFVLDRFERHLGGASVGLVLFSVTFGLGHLLKGYDAAIVTRDPRVRLGPAVPWPAERGRTPGVPRRLQPRRGPALRLVVSLVSVCHD